MSNLDRDLAEMRRLGYTSYGKYKLDHPSTKVETPMPGKPGRCAPPAKYRRECTYCGKAFVTADHRKTLCSDECKVLAAKKRYREKKQAKKAKADWALRNLRSSLRKEASDPHDLQQAMLCSQKPPDPGGLAEAA